MSNQQDNGNLFGMNLQHLRKMHGETLKEAGEELFLSGTAIKNYESGERTPNLQILGLIAKHYGKTVDELLNSDLTALGKMDFSIQGIDRFINIWETMVPLFKSESAMNDPDFHKGYDKCRDILDHFSRNEPVMGHVIIECFECFANAAENEIPESVANMIWIIILEWSQIMDQNMADIFTSIIYPRKNQKSTAKKIIQAKQNVSDEVVRKRKEFIKDFDGIIFELIEALKSDLEWAELGDYYLGLKYLLGIVDTGYSQEMNEAIGMQMLISLLRIGNKYAFETLHLMLAI